MTIAEGSRCRVVKTGKRASNYLGQLCTCVSNRPGALGSHQFEFSDGVRAYGDPHNVRVISEPETSQQPAEIGA